MKFNRMSVGLFLILLGALLVDSSPVLASIVLITGCLIGLIGYKKGEADED